jgi:4-diphosphocytidyl-2-C-methyl-D-erythritol kinase
MQSVALADELRMTLVPDSEKIRLTCDAQTLAVDQSNLVYQAATAVLGRTQRTVGLDIELQKRIPMGAGLGGGSSDAAATILGLNHLLELGWSREEMAQIGQALGSDVPFFLFSPTAVVTGRGETVRPITIEGKRWVLLVKPSFGVETKWAYQELARTRSGVRSLSAAHATLDERQSTSWSEVAASGENDFEEPVFTRYPLLGEIKQALRVQGADLALLSGSGATVFGLFHDELAARQAQSQFEREKQLNVFLVSTCSEAFITSPRLTTSA